MCFTVSCPLAANAESGWLCDPPSAGSLPVFIMAVSFWRLWIYYVLNKRLLLFHWVISRPNYTKIWCKFMLEHVNPNIIQLIISLNWERISNQNSISFVLGLIFSGFGHHFFQLLSRFLSSSPDDVYNAATLLHIINSKTNKWKVFCANLNVWVFLGGKQTISLCLNII